jgi:hypothetical protein
MTSIQRKRSTKTTQASTATARARKGATKGGAATNPGGSTPGDNSDSVGIATTMGDGAAVFSADERTRLIAIAAYYRAERRGFSGGSPEQDWLEAEAEIDGALGRQGS